MLPGKWSLSFLFNLTNAHQEKIPEINLSIQAIVKGLKSISLKSFKNGVNMAGSSQGLNLVLYSQVVISGMSPALKAAKSMA